MEKRTDEIQLRHIAMNTICRNAGELALSYFRSTTLSRQTKGIQDFVSEADCEVEKLIRNEIASRFPTDSILGEEGEAVAGESGFSWIIDPIDGTTVFLSGLTGWVVTVALISEQSLVAGVIYDPNSQELYSALKGGGATLNGLSLSPLQCQDISSGLVGTGFPRSSDPEEHGRFITDLLQARGNYYRDGSAASMLAKVAAGRLLGLYQPHLNSWDCLAGILLIQETGGKSLPVDMKTMLEQGGAVLVATPGVYEQLLAIIKR